MRSCHTLRVGKRQQGDQGQFREAFFGLRAGEIAGCPQDATGRHRKADEGRAEHPRLRAAGKLAVPPRPAAAERAVQFPG